MKEEYEIEKMIIDTMQQEEDHGGLTKWSGMTYEQGVKNALEWVVENGDSPLED